MNQEEFNYILSWVILINGIPPFYSAFICACWLKLVKRQFSKIACGTGLIIFLLIGTIRVFTAYEFDDQEIRIVNGILFMLGGIVANVLLTWSYLRRKRESKLLTVNELERVEKPFREYVTSSISHITPEKVTELVDQLKASDKVKLMQKFTKLRY